MDFGSRFLLDEQRATFLGLARYEQEGERVYTTAKLKLIDKH